MTIFSGGLRKNGNDKSCAASFCGSQTIRRSGRLRMEEERTTTTSALELEGFWVDGGFGVLELESLHGVDEDGRDGDVAIPLVVGRDDEPRRVFVAGCVENARVGLLILMPEPSLVEVGSAELPMFVGVVEAVPEAGGLLLV